MSAKIWHSMYNLLLDVCNIQGIVIKGLNDATQAKEFTSC